MKPKHVIAFAAALTICAISVYLVANYVANNDLSKPTSEANNIECNTTEKTTLNNNEAAESENSDETAQLYYTTQETEIDNDVTETNFIPTVLPEEGAKDEVHNEDDESTTETVKLFYTTAKDLRIFETSVTFDNTTKDSHVVEVTEGSEARIRTESYDLTSETPYVNYTTEESTVDDYETSNEEVNGEDGDDKEFYHEETPDEYEQYGYEDD